MNDEDKKQAATHAAPTFPRRPLSHGLWRKSCGCPKAIASSTQIVFAVSGDREWGEHRRDRQALARVAHGVENLIAHLLRVEFAQAD